MSYPPSISPGPYQPPPYYQPYPVIVAPPPTSGYATAAVVFGILSLLGGWCAIFPPFLAVLFGHLGRFDTRNGRRGGRGSATAGLILGYICLAPMVVTIAALVIGAAGAQPSTTTTP